MNGGKKPRTPAQIEATRKMLEARKKKIAVKKQYIPSDSSSESTNDMYDEIENKLNTLDNYIQGIEQALYCKFARDNKSNVNIKKMLYLLYFLYFLLILFFFVGWKSIIRY